MSHRQHKLVARRLVKKATCQGRDQKVVTKNQETNKPYYLFGQNTTLDNNVQLAICRQVFMSLSYGRIGHFLRLYHDLEISSGEMARVIQQKKIPWFPNYQKLLKTIDDSPSLRAEETPRKIQSLKSGWLRLVTNFIIVF